MANLPQNQNSAADGVEYESERCKINRLAAALAGNGFSPATRAKAWADFKIHRLSNPLLTVEEFAAPWAEQEKIFQDADQNEEEQQGDEGQQEEGEEQEKEGEREEEKNGQEKQKANANKKATIAPSPSLKDRLGNFSFGLFGNNGRSRSGSAASGGARGGDRSSSSGTRGGNESPVRIGGFETANNSFEVPPEAHAAAAAKRRSELQQQANERRIEELQDMGSMLNAKVQNLGENAVDMREKFSQLQEQVSENHAQLMGFLVAGKRDSSASEEPTRAPATNEIEMKQPRARGAASTEFKNKQRTTTFRAKDQRKLKDGELMKPWARWMEDKFFAKPEANAIAEDLVDALDTMVSPGQSAGFHMFYNDKSDPVMHELRNTGQFAAAFMKAANSYGEIVQEDFDDCGLQSVHQREGEGNADFLLRFTQHPDFAGATQTDRAKIFKTNSIGALSEELVRDEPTTWVGVLKTTAKVQRMRKSSKQSTAPGVTKDEIADMIAQISTQNYDSGGWGNNNWGSNKGGGKKGDQGKGHCYNWRAGFCTFFENCRFKHDPDQYGIDKTGRDRVKKVVTANIFKGAKKGAGKGDEEEEKEKKEE
jgi:hypothetical protein